VQSIEFITVSVKALRKNTWNTNQCSPDMEARIRKSIERNGLFKPILVRQVEKHVGYEIIGGEHRWEQAVALGYVEVPVANLGYVDELHAKEIGVIDNARYGVDDTLSLAELLKEIGDSDELQEFLPYGSADIDAIFSAVSIDLDDLELDEDFEKTSEPEEPALPKPSKTHTVMRFKIALADAERITALIASTRRTHDFTGADELTNAGDALVLLLNNYLTTGDPLDVLAQALKETDE
jgi:ParB-like chromosome segregation protein Spo0J